MIGNYAGRKMESLLFVIFIIGVPAAALIGFIVLLVKFIKLRGSNAPKMNKYKIDLIGTGVILLVSGTVFGVLLSALIALGNAFSDGINHM